MLSAQDPAEVPHEVLAELDGVGIFGGASDRALRHLGQDVTVFRALRPEDLPRLGPGELLLWSALVDAGAAR